MLRAMTIVLLVAIPVYAEPPAWPECMPYMHPTTCDDDIICTHDSCDSNGYCVFEPDHDDCDDEVVCNGPEYCDVTGGTGGNGCYHSYNDPCDEGTYCMETGGGWCSDCVLDFDWDDSIDCYDLALFDDCWRQGTIDCKEDVNGIFRMPADAGDECCSMNAHDQGDSEDVIDYEDFEGFAHCYGYDMESCDNCDGLSGNPLAWYTDECVDDCVDPPDHDGEPFYCDLPGRQYCQASYTSIYFETRVCVECELDSHCDGLLPECNAWGDSTYHATWTCEECTNDTHCSSPTPNCTSWIASESEATYTCEECANDGDCSMPFACCGGPEEDWECIVCQSK